MKTTALSCKHGTRALAPAVSVALMLAGVTAVATPAWQDLAAVRDAAKSAALESHGGAAENITVSAAELDVRLRLSACDAPLSAVAPATARTSARQTVAVQCTGSTPWRVHVPVTVTITRAVLVAAQPLERGKILAAEDVLLADRDLNTVIGGYLTDPRLAMGRVLRRGIPAGTVIGPAGLEAPVLIRRGQPVSVEARSGAIRVAMAGVAQADGALGEMIPVRNVQSKKILQGIVRNEKSVEIHVP